MSRSRLAETSGVDLEDREFLLSRCAELTEQFPKLEFALPTGPIHGDAYIGNLLTDGGRVVLSDFEAAAVGPREWDLLPTSIAAERYGLAEDVACHVYGLWRDFRDLVTWGDG
jgi:aminoglycoside phosphotransferase (APT) family kinase protein